MRVLNIFKSKLFLGLVLFSTTFIFFAYIGREVWFCLDDLGNIINGLIHSVTDFFKVFSQDERVYIYPVNFTIPKANIISGFYRPLQHIPFTLIYKCFGFYALAYYLTSVMFHALNTVLIFYLFSFYMPLLLAFLSGLVFAFCPILDWITWVSCLHNFMALFFMLLSLLFFRLFWVHKKFRWHFLAALMFLLSIISRENTILLGAWLFCSVLLTGSGLGTITGFWSRLSFAFKQTWLFFAVYLTYFLLRLNAFGLTTLDRTFNNLLLKYPVIKKFLFAASSTSIGVQAQAQASSVSSVTVVPSPVPDVSFVGKAVGVCKNVFVTWGSSLLNIDLSYMPAFLFACCLVIFIIFAYRKNYQLLLTLFLGFLFFIWPGIVAYPNPRYISAGYPFLLFIFFLAISFTIQKILHKSVRAIFYFVLISVCAAYIFHGVNKNSTGIKNICKEMKAYRQRFADFFEKNSFHADANFVVMGSPFASDIQNVFQAFLNNLDLKLAFVRESCIAQCGTMGCGGDYKIVNVPSKIEPVFMNGKHGFRFVSLDKDHCCWWMNYSHFPLKWSEQDRAYVWSENSLQVGQWYDFSMGKFIINDRVGQHFVTDVTFLLDDKWIDDKTVFVVWNSMQGSYEVLSKRCLD